MSVRLDIINSMLATTGTAKLAASDVGHPDYVAADQILDYVLDEFSGRALWFNHSCRTLAPNTDNRIVVPSNSVACDPSDTSLNYVQRGQYLFDMNNYTFDIESAVECIIQTAIDLEDMPPVAIQYIRASARFQYFVDKDGSRQKVEVYAQALSRYEEGLVAMNMKHSDVNFFKGAGYQDFITRRQTTVGHLPIRT